MSEEIITVIEKLSHCGRGIARIGGKTTFIEGALPNEKVKIKYYKKKSKFDEAYVTEVITQSPDRSESKCEHYYTCGGCNLQHMQSVAQINFKKHALLELFSTITKLADNVVMNSLQATSWHYRNRARLGVRELKNKNTVLLGFREKYSPRFLADIKHCKILPEIIGNNIVDLRNALQTLNSKHAIAQIELVAGDNAIGLIFRNLAELSGHDIDIIKNIGTTYGVRIFLQPKGPDSIYMIYPDLPVEPFYYLIRAYNIKVQFAPHDFTQVHSNMNQLMISQAMDWLQLTETDVVTDFFCGLGNFTLPLAKHCKFVIGVEGSDNMIRQAEINAHINNIHNVSFKVMNLFDKNALVNVLTKTANIWLLDPPRTGAIELVESITSENSPDKILYVSCNPSTLVRDADVLINKKNYKLVKLGVLDMFPQTAHVESMVMFIKKGVVLDG